MAPILPGVIDIEESPEPELLGALLTGPVTAPAMDEPRKEELLDVIPVMAPRMGGCSLLGSGCFGSPHGRLQNVT